MKNEIPVDASHVTVRLPEDHDPTKPFPLTIKRDFESPNCWATGDGKKVFRDREWAEKSMEMDTDAYKHRQRKSWECSRLIKAEVTSESIMIYSDDVSGCQDGYFSDVTDLIEQCEIDELPVPSYCFATKEKAFDFDVEGYLESYLCDEHHEEAHEKIVGSEELYAFMTAWCAKQTVRSYYVDYSKIIVIDKDRYEADLAQAKAWLSENSERS